MKFKIGDEVVLAKTTQYEDGETNPVWCGKHGKISGVIIDERASGYQVKWSNGRINSGYDAGKDLLPLKLVTYDDKYLPKTQEDRLEERSRLLSKKMAELASSYPIFSSEAFAEKTTKKSKQKAVPKEPKKPEVKLDLKQLDALVLAKEAKDEIEAVLKQHKNASVLFETWGLGTTIDYGRGMIFLFYGEPGTGKTWGANCIAKTTGKELLVISSAEIESSEPGGAQRALQQAFKTAKEKGKIIFLDECDSLITRRNDVGMILGSQINTLLTEIEKFEGICILATNRIETLDEALERRISLIVEFPEPTQQQRLDIWKRLIPAKLPLDKDVVLNKLAEYKLTGGQIKNVLLQASRLALSTESKKVNLSHFETAISRIHKSKSLMGTASRYKQITTTA